MSAHLVRNFTLLLAATLLPATASAQTSQGAIDCSRGGAGKNCQVQLAPGQNVATIHFQPSTRYLGSARLEYKVAPLPNGVAKEAIAHGEEPGVFTYVWFASGAEQDTVRLLVQRQTPGLFDSDTIHVLPAKRPAHRVEIPRYYPYVWLRDNWLPITIRAEVEGGGQTALDAEACSRIRFAFQARAGGKADPDTGSARWNPDDQGCYAETRWKLGDATGDQQMRLVVGDGERVARTEQTLRAYAREEPRIVAGIGWFTRHDNERTRYCRRPDTPEAECASVRFESDTLKREFPQREEEVAKTFFGVELPVFLPNQPGNRVTTFLSQRTRILVGSTFEESADNLFVGLTLLPVFVPAYERIPVQVHAGWRPARGGFFAGGSVDGKALITDALKALGAPL